MSGSNFQGGLDWLGSRGIEVDSVGLIFPGDMTLPERWSFRGSVLVTGKVTGDIVVRGGVLYVAPGGCIDGEITAESAVVAGTAEGTALCVRGVLTVADGAHILPALVEYESIDIEGGEVSLTARTMRRTAPGRGTTTAKRHVPSAAPVPAQQEAVAAPDMPVADPPRGLPESATSLPVRAASAPAVDVTVQALAGDARTVHAHVPIDPAGGDALADLDGLSEAFAGFEEPQALAQAPVAGSTRTAAEVAPRTASMLAGGFGGHFRR